MVEAYNTTSTADSPVVSVTLPTPPPQSLTPPKVTATAISSTTVVLSWNQVAGTQGYRIYYFNGNRPVLLGTVNAMTTSVQIINLRPNSTARFIVEAFSNTQVADSAVVSVTMPAIRTRTRHHNLEFGSW
jgi:hypothetical protein